MLTSKDIEYDSPVFKIFSLTNSIGMLIAGDAASQMQILDGDRAEIADRLRQDQGWMWVQEVANIVGRQTGLSHPLLKFSGGSVDDYATIPDDSSSPS